MERYNWFYGQYPSESELDDQEKRTEEAIGKAIAGLVRGKQCILTKDYTPVATGAPDWYIHFPEFEGYSEVEETIELTNSHKYHARCHFETTQDVDCQNDYLGSPVTPSVGNLRYIAVFVKFMRVESIPRLDKHGATIYYHQFESFEFEVHAGTEHATDPVNVPTPNGNYIKLCDVKIDENVGATGISDPTDPENPEINEIDYTGLNYLGLANNENLDDLMWVDRAVKTQNDFNNLFERVSANLYKIKDNIISIYFKHFGGGYKMSSVLSGGDTWGYIQTNNCSTLKAAVGGYIDMENERGYLEVNTDDCILDGIDIQGTGTVASATSQSFLLNAHRVIFRGCKTSSRLSNMEFIGFQGSVTVLHNITSKYTDCCAYDLDSNGNLIGFRYCQNLKGCTSYDLESTDSMGVVYGFRFCYQISDCYAYNIISTVSGCNAYGFGYCDQITNCKAENVSYSAFSSCRQMSSCMAIGINSTRTATGFSGCDQISSCYAQGINSTGNDAYGFVNCDQVVGCKAYGIDHSGSVANRNAYGFSLCIRISGCHSLDIDTNGAGGIAEGFNNCNYGSALYTNEAINSGNDWIDTVDAQITNKVSTPSVWT